MPDMVTVDEGDVTSARLSIQLLLMPTSATLQSDIIVTVSVSSGSATGMVYGQVIITITPTQRSGRLVATTLWIYAVCFQWLEYCVPTENRKKP